MTTINVPDRMWFSTKPQVMHIGPEAWEAFRSAFRSLGPRHRLVDRWRYDLKWNVPESAIANWLAEERSKLVAKGGNA